MEGEWSCLQNGHVREAPSLMGGEWSCYNLVIVAV